jgi:hypothetical protein
VEKTRSETICLSNCKLLQAKGLCLLPRARRHFRTPGVDYGTWADSAFEPAHPLPRSLRTSSRRKRRLGHSGVVPLGPCRADSGARALPDDAALHLSERREQVQEDMGLSAPLSIDSLGLGKRTPRDSM